MQLLALIEAGGETTVRECAKSKRRSIFDLSCITINRHVINDQVGIDSIGQIELIVSEVNPQRGSVLVTNGRKRVSLELSRRNTRAKHKAVG